MISSFFILESVVESIVSWLKQKMLLKISSDNVF